MKQVCIHCHRESSGGNLWCTESNCATELKPMVFEYGESIADLRIKKVLTVLRNAAIYEAIQGEETDVLVKVAHEGFEERLKRESQFLADLQQKGQSSKMLPTLLPSHPNAELSHYSYGKTVFRDKTKYYAIYEHSDGGILRGILRKNPQPWYQEVGWILLGICDAIQLIHQNQRFHLNLSPEIVLVRHGKYGKKKEERKVPIPMLLDLGVIAEREAIEPSWVVSSCNTAYVAPEFFQYGGSGFGRRTDVYGLGMLLYEMFAGQPAYPFELKADVEVRSAVERGKLNPLVRPDLDPRLVSLVNQAVQGYEQRQESTMVLASELLQHFPPVPAEKVSKPFNWRIFWIIMITLIAIALIIVTAFLLAEGFSY